MKPKVVILVLILIVALVVRLDNIGPRTEFLGDQGVIATELYNSFKSGYLPSTGLMHSNGIRTGPILFYLMAPSYFLAGNNPVGISVFMALVGVATVFLLFIIGESLYGRVPALIAAGAYALSPLIAAQSRAIWPPAFLPFFSVVGLFGLVWMRQKQNPAWLVVVSAAGAVMSQMYIPALPTVVFLGVTGLLLLLSMGKRHSGKTLLFWFMVSAACFFVIWVPFLIYESAHEFEDIRMFLLTTFFSNAPSGSLGSTFGDRVGLIRSVFEKLLPIGQPQLVGIIGGLFTVVAFVFGGFWGRLLVFWYAVSTIPILLFAGPTFEHYVAMLLPLPFFLLGFLLKQLSIFPKYMTVLVVCILLLLQISTGSKVQTYNDLTRTESLVDEMVAQSKGQDFSFTPLSSRSFSDYHYRYFFLRKGIAPQVVYEDYYPVLFLICEESACPPWKDLQKRGIISVLCYEKHCNPSYPDKRLTGWKFEREVVIEGAHLLTLRLNTVQ